MVPENQVGVEKEFSFSEKQNNKNPLGVPDKGSIFSNFLNTNNVNDDNKNLQEENMFPRTEDSTIITSQDFKDHHQELSMMYQDLHTVVLPQGILICQWMTQSSTHQSIDHVLGDPQETLDKGSTYQSNHSIQQ